MPNSCNTCDGSGYIYEMGPVSGHAPDCEGDCRDCPIIIGEDVVGYDYCGECMDRYMVETYPPEVRGVAIVRSCDSVSRFGPGRDPGCHLIGTQDVLPMTMYGDEPKSYWMCDHCAREYRAFWQEQWDEYHTMVMGGLSAGVSDFSGIHRTYAEVDFERHQAIEDALNDLLRHGF